MKEAAMSKASSLLWSTISTINMQTLLGAQTVIDNKKNILSI